MEAAMRLAVVGAAEAAIAFRCCRNKSIAASAAPTWEWSEFACRWQLCCCRSGGSRDAPAPNSYTNTLLVPLPRALRSDEAVQMNTRILSSPGKSALRRGRWSEPGRSYLITFTCHDRIHLFSNVELAMVAARTLAEVRLWRKSRLLCWVLMPDHWHGLVELADVETLSMLVARVKSVSAAAVNLAAGGGVSVWASGFHDRAMRRDDDLVGTARYIVGNPIRAGLCERVGDYPFWDAMWL